MTVDHGRPPAPLRYGYVTNGLTDHRLGDALALLSDCGYQGVGLTLDHHHLDPFAPDLSARVEAVARRLEEVGLDVVIETGARFLLDPRRKHEPTLMSDGRAQRVEFLRRAIAVAADLGAPVVSFWAGVAPAELDQAEAWRRLVGGCEELVSEAHARGVTLGLEPEPGMLVERLDDWDRLAESLDHPAALGLTLDLGHCRCVEDDPVDACVHRVGGRRLVHVHIEDMCRGVHEHLDFGQGEIDFPPVLTALGDVGYRGLVCVELSRHSHAAHTVVPSSIAFLRNAEGTKATTATPDLLAGLGAALRRRLSADAASWLDEAVTAVAADSTAIRARFPAVGRKVGRAALGDDREAGSGWHLWTADEAARALLLGALGSHVLDEIVDLYRYGDAAERRAVLRSLHLLPVHDGALPLVLDALRTNDGRIVGAAMGPYAVTHLPDDVLRHAVLKCVFMGLPLAAIPGLQVRADAELARMLAAYAHERVAAGRDVPVDVWPLIDRFPPEAELAAIAAEVLADTEPRRQAACRALAGRETSRPGS